MKEPMSLDGKKILITGASSGIGRAAAIYCSELGARLVLNGRDGNRLEETVDALHGTGHITFIQDFYQQPDCSELFKTALSDGQKFDGFVHCVGIAQVMPLKSLSQERLHKVMSTNFYSFVELARNFVKKSNCNDGASVLGVSGAILSYPRKYELSYIASKAAIEAAIQVMAVEYGKRRIRVNCISPGNVDTEMSRKITNELDNQEARKIAIERAIFGMQTPEDIAKVCAFLMSDESSTITSSIIHADGGYNRIL